MARSKAHAFLINRYTDKVLAVLAILPIANSLYVFVMHAFAGQSDPFSFGIAFWGIFTVVPMIFRRTATRVSTKPLDWFITAGRTYWMFVMYYVLDTAHAIAIVPSLFPDTIFWLSVCIIIYARIYLGRNIGFVPARRSLVTTGIYGWVRHPIHTGQLLFYIAFALKFFSIWNWIVIGIGMAFVFAKTLAEDRFLKEDEDYRAYCAKVPWRWVPWIA